jgi:hypothetical protein
VLSCHYIIRVVLAGALAFTLVTGAASQTMPPMASGTPAEKVLDFRPGLDDLMTMLIQPRHIKLYFAGSRKNWELAASQARDLRLAFVRISQFMPKYLGIDVAEALGSIMDPSLSKLDKAIAAADPKHFAVAYDEVTGACNGCHAYMEHGYLVIKRPLSSSAAMYPDQQFGANP